MTRGTRVGRARSGVRAVGWAVIYALAGFVVFVAGARYAVHCERTGKKSLLLYRPPPPS
jgi:hypothetical protein